MKLSIYIYDAHTNTHTQNNNNLISEAEWEDVHIKKKARKQKISTTGIRFIKQAEERKTPHYILARLIFESV